MDGEWMDDRWMAACARLAARARPIAHPNPGVAALIVRKDASGERVIARGWTRAGGRPHAEAAALAQLPEGGPAGCMQVRRCFLGNG